MLNRVFRNWTIVRVIYLVMGIVVIVQAITTQQWIGVLLGGYFAAMGLFSFGCAGGACFGGMQQSYKQPEHNASLDQVNYEEVK